MSLDAPEEDTPQENLAILSEYRSKNVRSSEEIVRSGERVLRTKGALRRMGDEGRFAPVIHYVGVHWLS